MASILPTNPAGSGGAASSATNTTGPGSLANQNTFIQLLVAELQNQDPLQPTNTSDLMTQMVQFEEVTQLADVASAVQTLGTAAAVEEGVALLGHSVTYQGQNGTQASGTVSGVTVENGTVLLQIGQERVPLSQVVSIGG
jgi:flagellar basal-body rod modification protein FlgD